MASALGYVRGEFAGPNEGAKIITMTTAQKTILIAAMAVAIGTSVLSLYEARQAADLRGQTERHQQQHEPLMQQVEQLRLERDAAQKQIQQLRRDNADLPRLRGEVTRLQANAQELASLKAGDSGKPTGGDTLKETDPTQSAEKLMVAKVNQLKQSLEQMPEKKIPELQFLTENDWIRVAGRMNLETEADFRRAYCSLRMTAKQSFAREMALALNDYAQANGGQLPPDISQLAPYFQPPVGDAILQRYQVVGTGLLSNTSFENLPVAEKAPPVDEQYDTLIKIGPRGWIVKGTGSLTGQDGVGMGTPVRRNVPQAQSR